MTFFFFLRSTENSEKSRPTPTKILAPPETNFAPLKNNVLVVALSYGRPIYLGDLKFIIIYLLTNSKNIVPAVQRHKLN